MESVGALHMLSAGAMSMPQFADYLAAQTDSPVINLTEMTGKYDIAFYYSKPFPISGIAPGAPPDNRFDILPALREQLGLELQRRKVQAALLIVDHIEQTPSPN